MLSGIQFVLGMATGTPARLMLSTWFAFLAFLFLLSPIEYTRAFLPKTVLFVGVCIITFVGGALFAANPPRRRGPFGKAHRFADRRRFLPELDAITVNRIIRITAILGLLGAVFVVIDKVVFMQLDLSQGLGKLREAQMNSDGRHGRSILLFLGMLMFSFSDVSVALAVLDGRIRGKLTGWLVVMTSFSPAVVAMLYGGRSPAIFLVVLVICACLIRVSEGRSFLPPSREIRFLGATYFLIVVAGSLYVFSERAKVHTYANTADLVYSFSEDLDAKLSRRWKRLVDAKGPSSELAASTGMAVIYGTHGLSELNYLVSENTDAGPFFGQWQGFFLFRSIGVLFRRPTTPETMHAELHRPGLFLTAWGEMYLDFGFLFAPVVALLLGIAAGWCHRLAVRDGSLPAKLFLAYLYLYILVSPVLSGINVGNSLQALCCIMLTSVMLRKKAPAAHAVSPVCPPII